MYLSRIAIDLKNRNTMRALDNPEILHGMVESCFPGSRQRNLWRVDELNGQSYLLVLSPIQPDMSSLAAQIGLPGAAWETKDYEPLLKRIRIGSIWNFRIAANPVICRTQPEKARGKIKGVTIAEHQRMWLMRQGERHGFLLTPGQFDTVRSEWKIFHTRGRHVSLFSATFEGVLTVTDPARFCEALVSGIGRGKAYGMGLITVVSHE